MESSSIETKSQESYVSNQKQFCKKGVLRKFCKIQKSTSGGCFWSRHFDKPYGNISLNKSLGTMRHDRDANHSSMFYLFKFADSESQSHHDNSGMCFDQFHHLLTSH